MSSGDGGFFDKLLPCPFCGSRVLGVGHPIYRIECPHCDAHGPNGEDKEQARKLWNMREKEVKP